MISNITLIKKVNYSVWNVVFQMDNEELEYTTDFLYLIKEKKWVFNSLITHELTSIVEGHKCKYCGEAKIACLVASQNHKQIKDAIIKNEQFLQKVHNELQLPIEEISTDSVIINDKRKWEKLEEENRFYGNLLRLKSEQQ